MGTGIRRTDTNSRSCLNFAHFVRVSGDLPDDATRDWVERHRVLEGRRRCLQDHVLLQDVWTLLVQLRYRLHQPGQVINGHSTL
jgi:hypothetical protein